MKQSPSPALRGLKKKKNPPKIKRIKTIEMMPDVMRTTARMLAYHMVIYGIPSITINTDLTGYEVRFPL